MTSTDLAEDAVIRRLRVILDELAEASAGSFSVEESEEEGWRVVSVAPLRRGALGFWWIHRGDVIFGLDPHGVRWELQPTAEDLDFLAAVVRSVVAGRVRAVFAPGRAEVTVTLADGTHEKQNNARAPVGCLPLPFWPRWGKHLDYLPYQ
ncbi:hypothetical protein OG455_02560 [Kitasatospora sp. NBC_01287]|uniref:hypothetical protein n=1 Tax=Kitasatospora sp. NBC_01287 TaxID=2903573 RepID=UPI00224D7EC3|nr:hypothetical protein [Kitasatospora sp. NBC_01287]MCX4744408.1 hypothetical protein [Kitasatospora sp. NBC_01287]